MNTRLLPLLASLTLQAPPQFDAREKALAVWGRKLFFDPRFSADGRTSCASCHRPERAFTDGEATPSGHPGVRRNTPTVADSFNATWLFWDGRASSLVAQVIGPLESPFEMGMRRSDVAHLIGRYYRADFEQLIGPWPEALVAQAPPGSGPLPARLAPDVSFLRRAAGALRADLHASLMRDARRAKQPEQRLFAARYLKTPDPADPEAAAAASTYAALELPVRRAVEQAVVAFAQAIAAYERGLVTTASPFDRFAARVAKSGQPTAALGDDFGQEEWRGFQVFVGNGGCITCHHGSKFSDGQFHNVGLAARDSIAELGRAEGIQLALEDPWGCKGDIQPQPDSETCRELGFLDAQSPQLLGAFKTPSLRNVAVTGPYGHDGRFRELVDVLRHYREASEQPLLGHREATIRPLLLGDRDIDALVAFLNSLTSTVEDLSGS